MSKLEDAKKILWDLQVPTKQRNDICCYVLLAMAGLLEDSEWKLAKNSWVRIHDIIAFLNKNYGTTYAENSRETFRKQAMHHFRNAAFIEDNGKATNSSKYCYRLTLEMLKLVQSFETAEWGNNLIKFQERHDSLISIYSSRREMQKMPIEINGKVHALSSGKHNELQKKVIEEFAPRFIEDVECLYIGDTIKKDLVKDVEKLHSLGLDITLHDKMPDIVLYSKERNWLYFIEAVTTVGPMDYKRIKELDLLTANINAGKIYITAFPDFKTFKRFSEVLAWETEVWIADMPEHMIHFDGDKLLEPRK